MYNQIIIDNFSNPQHAGSLELADYEIEIGNPVCGDRIKIQFLAHDDFIDKAVFKAWGCATSVATANIFCDSVCGQPVNSITQRSTEHFTQMLGELEPSQHHCLHIFAQLHEKLAAILKKGVV